MYKKRRLFIHRFMRQRLRNQIRIVKIKISVIRITLERLTQIYADSLSPSLTYLLAKIPSELALIQSRRFFFGDTTSDSVGI